MIDVKVTSKEVPVAEVRHYMEKHGVSMDVAKRRLQNERGNKRRGEIVKLIRKAETLDELKEVLAKAISRGII